MLINRFEESKPFSEEEAWFLFKIAAIGEACGWTLLILGILSKQFIFHGNNIPVLITGQIHGTIFLVYIIAALGLYPSLGWSRKRSIAAALASVPPYGSLLFEQWAAYMRRASAIRQSSHFLIYTAMLESDVRN